MIEGARARDLFICENFERIGRIVRSQAKKVSARYPFTDVSLDDFVQEGMIVTLELLRRLDTVDATWPGLVKIAVRGRLLDFSMAQARRNAPTLPFSENDLTVVDDPFGDREQEAEQVRRRVKRRQAAEQLSLQLTPSAREIFELQLRPPLALQVMARNLEGRVAPVTRRHLVRWTGQSHLSVERACREIARKAARLAA